MSEGSAKTPLIPNLDNQRNAVQEERRLSVDNQPYGKSGEIQRGLIYDNFAYKHTVIGSMDDLNAATVEDVAAFFKTYYAPNNAVLTLVGSFALSLEQPQALLRNTVDQNLYGMPADYWEVYPQKVMAITAEDVQRVAQKYIDLNHMQIVAVGDAKKTREVLAKFGTVEDTTRMANPWEP